MNNEKDEKPKAIDFVTDAERADLTQYRPSEEELKALGQAREDRSRRISEVMECAALNAERKYYAGETLDGANSGEFVNSCYLAEEVDLMFLEGGVNAKKMNFSKRLTEVYGFGERVNLNSLLRGDLIFFNRGRLVGIHVGGGDFITLKGDGELVLGNIEDDYWEDLFEGQIRRLAR